MRAADRVPEVRARPPSREPEDSRRGEAAEAQAHGRATIHDLSRELLPRLPVAAILGGCAPASRDFPCESLRVLLPFRSRPTEPPSDALHIGPVPRKSVVIE